MCNWAFPNKDVCAENMCAEMAETFLQLLTSTYPQLHVQQYPSFKKNSDTKADNSQITPNQ